MQPIDDHTQGIFSQNWDTFFQFLKKVRGDTPPFPPSSARMVYRIAIKMNLISLFMTGCTKTLHKLKQTCIFQLPYCVCMYDILRLSNMKVLKGKTVHKINGLVKNIGTGA